MARGLFALATEDMEVDEVVVDDTAIADTIEITDGVNDLTADMSDISEASSASDEIAEIQDVAQNSIESGEGLPEAAVEMMIINLNSINRRLGLKSRSLVKMPSMEDFSAGTKSRIKATKAVLEAAEEGNSSLKEKIVEKLNAVKAKISAVMKNLFDRNTKNLNAAKALKVSDTKPKDGTDVSKIINKACADYTSVATKMTKQFDDINKQIVKNMNTIIKLNQDGGESKDEKIKAVLDDHDEKMKAGLSSASTYKSLQESFKSDMASVDFTKSFVTQTALDNVVKAAELAIETSRTINELFDQFFKESSSLMENKKEFLNDKFRARFGDMVGLGGLMLLPNLTNFVTTLVSTVKRLA